MRQLQFGQVELAVGDIVDQQTDAIVNAANGTLAGGGGVDGAIHRAAGPELLRLCLLFPSDDRGYRCQTGDVRITAAGNLAAKYVIHAVGPIYDQYHAEKSCDQLRQVHQRALQAAISKECRSIAFPAISTGAFGFPLQSAAPIAIDTVCRFLQTENGIDHVRFVLFQQHQYDVFAAALDDWSSHSN